MAGMVISLTAVQNWLRNEPLRAKITDEVLSGKKKMCLAVTEAFAGSDVAGLRTTAEKTPDGKFYIINGTKYALPDIPLSWTSFRAGMLMQTVTQEMNQDLMRALTMKEVRRVVFSLGSLKAPRPDGLPGFFYQHYWSIVQGEVFDAIQAVFQFGFLLRELDESNVVLIPKVVNPETVGENRPISCSNPCPSLT